MKMLKMRQLCVDTVHDLQMIRGNLEMQTDKDHWSKLYQFGMTLLKLIAPFIPGGPLIGLGLTAIRGKVIFLFPFGKLVLE